MQRNVDMTEMKRKIDMTEMKRKIDMTETKLGQQFCFTKRNKIYNMYRPLSAKISAEMKPGRTISVYETKQNLGQILCENLGQISYETKQKLR